MKADVLPQALQASETEANILVSRARKRRQAKIAKLSMMLLGFAIFFGLWFLAVDYFKLPRFSKLPGLHEVVTEWISRDPMYGISIFTEEYYAHILVSLIRIGIAFFSATILGVPLGLMLGWSERFREYVFPVFETLRPVPILAWVPISIILFNGSEVSVIFLTFIAAFFVTTLNTMQGVRSIDETYIRAGASLGASSKQVFWDVIIPGSLPSIFTGLQISIGVSWFSLVAAEMVSGEYGLGYIINTSYTKIQYPTIAIGMFTLGIVGYVSSSIIRMIGDVLMRWRLREIGASA